MFQPFQIQSIHHFTLTVSDVRRSCEFYTRLPGFQAVLEFGPRVLLANGNIILALTPPLDSNQAISGDLFNENRLGLDHLSFGVASRDELEQAARWFEQNGIPHGEIRDLGSDFSMYVLAFRDPDNIQLELTAPYPVPERVLINGHIR